MSSIVKAIGSIFGMGSSPKVDTSTASTTVEEGKTSAQKARTALLETAGGQAGETLNADQVSDEKTTLFGN